MSPSGCLQFVHRCGGRRARVRFLQRRWQIEAFLRRCLSASAILNALLWRGGVRKVQKPHPCRTLGSVHASIQRGILHFDQVENPVYEDLKSQTRSVSPPTQRHAAKPLHPAPLPQECPVCVLSGGCEAAGLLIARSPSVTLRRPMKATQEVSR